MIEGLRAFLNALCDQGSLPDRALNRFLRPTSSIPSGWHQTIPLQDLEAPLAHLLAEQPFKVKGQRTILEKAFRRTEKCMRTITQYLDPPAVRTGRIKLYAEATSPRPSVQKYAQIMSSRSQTPEASLLTLGEDLTPLPDYKAASTSTIDFSGLLSPPLKLHEDLTSGCGGQLWPAGMVLAKYMLRYHRDDLNDAKILELGAGGGLVGLCVALGCAADAPIYITDQIDMLPLMGQNVALNGLESRVVPLVLNWGDSLPPAVKLSHPTHILAADCVYFEPAFPLLLSTLSALLGLNPSASVYFCFKKRRRADMQFMKKAKKMFKVQEVEDEDKEVWRRDRLFLYVFKNKDT